MIRLSHPIVSSSCGGATSISDDKYFWSYELLSKWVLFFLQVIITLLFKFQRKRPFRGNPDIQCFMGHYQEFKRLELIQKSLSVPAQQEGEGGVHIKLIVLKELMPHLSFFQILFKPHLESCPNCQNVFCTQFVLYIKQLR